MERDKKYIIPAPEEIALGSPYALTINPAFYKKCMKFDIKIIDEQYQNICSILDEIREYVQFKVYFELSCLGKLHIHGQIVFAKDTLMSFYAYCVPWMKDHCTFAIKALAEQDTATSEFQIDAWPAYCQKQRHLMKDWMKNNLAKKVSYADNEIIAKMTSKVASDKQFRLDYAPREWTRVEHRLALDRDIEWEDDNANMKMLPKHLQKVLG